MPDDKAKPHIAGVYQVRVVLRNDGTIDDTPTVADVEAVIEAAIRARFGKFDVKAAAVRTDR